MHRRLATGLAASALALITVTVTATAADDAPRTSPRCSPVGRRPARQYRSDQAYGDGWQYPGPESEDPARTPTGDAQERWLIDGWHRSRALWYVVPQQVTFSRRYNTTTLPSKVSVDSWDGYPASRERVLAGAAAVDNLMVLTGDVHVHYGFDIKRDFADPASRTVGTEIVTSSVTSGGNGSARPSNWATYLAANPHL